MTCVAAIELDPSIFDRSGPSDALPLPFRRLKARASVLLPPPPLPPAPGAPLELCASVAPTAERTSLQSLIPFVFPQDLRLFDPSRRCGPACVPEGGGVAAAAGGAAGGGAGTELRATLLPPASWASAPSD